MVTEQERVDQFIGYLKLHGISFDFRQYEEMTRLFCRCQGRQFDVEAFAGFLTVVRYALMEKPLHQKKDYLEYAKSVIHSSHNVAPCVDKGVAKLYEVFAAAYDRKLMSGLPVATEFKAQLKYLAEVFTSYRPDPNEGDNL